MTDAGFTAASPFDALRARLAPPTGHRTDGQLLAAFVTDRDPDAFAALVHRLGPRVLAVCRRITGHAHDADDAFQSVFLVLARRAAVVCPPEAVAGWVYGVAVRTAQDARAMAARRRSRVAPVATVPDTPVSVAEPPDGDELARLDAAIATLPNALRAAVVLCELDGVSRREAAKRLGIAEGTLSSRLASARKRLAAAVGAKSVAVVGLLALLASTVSGSVPLFAQAGRWGPLAAAGEPIPVGAHVALADRVGRIMLLNKLKPLLAATACALLLLAAGWGPLTRLVAADPPVAKAEPAKPPKAVNKLLIWQQQEVFTLDPDGKNETKLFELEKFQGVSCPTLSPDGKRVAYLTHTTDPKDAKPGERQVYTFAVREVGGKDVTAFQLHGQMLAWSPDGKELLVTDFTDEPSSPKDGPRPPKATTTVLELSTKKETTLSLPDGHIATAFGPDGKQVLTTRYEVVREKPTLVACLVSRDGKEVKPLSDPDYLFELGQLSPDGKTLLFAGMKCPDKFTEDALVDPKLSLYVQPVGGKVVELADVPRNGEIQGYCWSPDGKKIAYTWREIHAKKAEQGKADDRETESHLMVCDADGKNAKTILSEKGKSQWHITLSSVCWR